MTFDEWKGDHNLQGYHNRQSWIAGERAAYAACAELVRAAGCNCEAEFSANGTDERPDQTKEKIGDRYHYTDCPVALADAIEARGKGVERAPLPMDPDRDGRDNLRHRRARHLRQEPGHGGAG